VLTENVGVVCLVVERGFRGREVEGIEIGAKSRLGGGFRLAPVETLGRIGRFVGLEMMDSFAGLEIVGRFVGLKGFDSFVGLKLGRLVD